MKQAPVPALNQKGEDFQPAGGRNVAALQPMKVCIIRNSYVHVMYIICLAFIEETLTIHISVNTQ